MRRRATFVLALALHTAVVPLLGSPMAIAQEETAAASTDLIVRGRAFFDDQRYEESIQTLSAALIRPNNTRTQKVEIYRLLALNYITLNRKHEADSAVRGLLAFEPEYTLPPTESPRFRDFFAAARERWETDGRPGLVVETAPPPIPVTMTHTSPSQAETGTQITLTARFNDPQHRVQVVKLFYRAGSRNKFEHVDATLEGSLARVSIPPSAVKPPIIEYYLAGYDTGGLPLVARGDATAPLRIAVPEPAKGWILPLAIGGGVVGAAAIFGGLALAGVFKSGSGGGGPSTSRPATVTVTVGE